MRLPARSTGGQELFEGITCKRQRKDAITPVSVGVRGSATACMRHDTSDNVIQRTAWIVGGHFAARRCVRVDWVRRRSSLEVASDQDKTFSGKGAVMAAQRVPSPPPGICGRSQRAQLVHKFSAEVVECRKQPIGPCSCLAAST